MNLDREFILELINIAELAKRDLTIDVSTKGDISINYNIPSTYITTTKAILNEEK